MKAIHLFLILILLYNVACIRLDGRVTAFPAAVDAVQHEHRSIKVENIHSRVTHHPFQPLKVICEVNGHSIPAIIDTGAQVSIISMACAKRCGLLRNIDTRYQGKAIGVGSSDIIGRVDDLNIQLGPITFKSRVSVLDKSGVEFLIGLDFLRNFHAEVNLRENVIRLQVQNKIIRIPFIVDGSSMDAIDYSAHREHADQHLFALPSDDISHENHHTGHNSASFTRKSASRLFGKPYVQPDSTADDRANTDGNPEFLYDSSQDSQLKRPADQEELNHTRSKVSGLHDRYSDLLPRNKKESEDDSRLSMEGV